MVEHPPGKAPVAYISRQVGLPCRSANCTRVFKRLGMQSDFAVLLATAADRDAHELAEHDLVVTPPAEHRGRDYATHAAGGRARWQRARIGMNLP